MIILSFTGLKLIPPHHRYCDLIVTTNEWFHLYRGQKAIFDDDLTVNNRQVYGSWLT